MRIVRAKPWREYFRRTDAMPDDFTSLPWHLTHHHLFHPLLVQLAIGSLLMLGSLFERFCFVLFLTQTAFLATLYLHVRSTARGLFFRRSIDTDPLIENAEAKVTIDIVNASLHRVRNLLLFDSFGPTLEQAVRLNPDRELLPQSKSRFHYTRLCDGGMGTHTIGPISARISDPLGIFEWIVSETELTEITVQPKIARLPELPSHGARNSVQYGAHEVNTRGLSVNFSGVRPYGSGDSFRHIAWKLSAKTQGLLVKEFEKSVNAQVAVLLNLDRSLLTGHKGDSTWEYAKDAALAIISQQLDQGNTVALYSNHIRVEESTGRNCFATFCRAIASLDPTRLSADGDPAICLKRNLHLLSPGTTIFYISPYHQNEHRLSFPLLRSLRAAGNQVACVYVDTNSFWPLLMESLSGADESALLPAHGFAEALERLKLAGIQTVVWSHRGEIADAFLPRQLKRERS